jgi:hypothetical protein
VAVVIVRALLVIVSAAGRSILAAAKEYVAA